jgi:ornithine--oxo-acid transaminase
MDPAKNTRFFHDRRVMVAVERTESDPGKGLPQRTQAAIDELNSYTARNYNPLPVVVAEADGVWVTDVEGKRYLDMLAAYSALNFGHGHPRLVAVARDQLDRLTLTSRAFHNDQLGVFGRELAELCGMDLILPMNTGAEAVETAIKTARKWGYRVKGVAHDRAKVIVATGNFHGRTTTIISFSDDPEAHEDYGPYTPGFVMVPYGDEDAVREAIDDDTVAVLIEPIQGEAGVIIPPAGYLTAIRRFCTERGVLMVADEIQTGLGRTGLTFACDYEGVRPDMYVLGKALGGGIVPVSAVVSDQHVLGVYRPGEHGSTFGGNPLACAVGIEVVRMLKSGEYQERAALLGKRLTDRLEDLPTATVSGFRSRGLWAGVDIIGRTGRDVSEGLLKRGVLTKDTHGSTVRIAPPLTISEDELEWGLDRFAEEVSPK